MRQPILIAAATAALLVLPTIGCKKKKNAPPEGKPTAGVSISKDMLAAYAPLPQVMPSSKNAITAAKVSLGRMLYYDTRLSKNHDLSCNSCHMLDKFGVDGEPTSPGHKKQRGNRNSPTVYNAAGHVAQFWDGREPDVEAQAKGPVLNPVEMAMPNAQAVVKVLKSIPGYVKEFAKAFPKAREPVTYDNMAKAIGAFERKLVTPSRWDRFLKGDKTALSAAEKKGFLAFSMSGCPTCHTGALLGGHMYQKLGLVNAWPNLNDKGRFDVTKKAPDKMMFKVPSLRNVAKTGPYFHDGSVASLKDAVAKMAWHQLGQKMDKAKAGEVVAFLGSLTGELPAAYIKKPALPPSGKDTPKPDPS